MPETTTPTELWFSESGNWGEPTIFYRQGDEIRTMGSDDAPDAVVEDAPEGWSVWEGTRRQLTAEELTEDAMEEAGTYYPSFMRPGDWWWEGELRPATVTEILAFFQPQADRSAPGDVVPLAEDPAAHHVSRLVESLQDFVAEHPDPGTEALGALYCAKEWLGKRAAERERGGIPCFDPCCDCCKAWDRKVRQLEDDIPSPA